MEIADVWRNNDLENWILLSLYTENFYDSYYGSKINPKIIISECPETLAVKIPNEYEILKLLEQMEIEGKLERVIDNNFKISTNGILYLRKYLYKLKENSQDDKYISKIIDKTEGTTKSKKEIKKKLKEIKDLAIDDFYEEFRIWLRQAGREAIFQVIRLLSENPSE